jgi:hypothetical protein
MNVLHIGLQKTASTTLQDTVFAEQDQFVYLGPLDNKFPEPVKELVARISFQDSFDYEPQQTRAIVDGLRRVDKPFLVSSEGFSVEGGADRGLIAERLRVLFAPAKILIVLRAQPALCQSMYLHHVRSSGQRAKPFAEWLDDDYGDIYFRGHYRVGLDYEQLVRTYEELFGSENVIVLPLELIKDKNSLFTSVLGELFHMPAARVRALMDGNVANARLSRRHMFAVQVQNLLPNGTNLALLGRRFMPGPLYDRVRGFVVSGQRVESPEVPEKWRARIFDMCARGNAELQKRKNLPLAELGYPVAESNGAARSQGMRADLRSQ